MRKPNKNKMGDVNLPFVSVLELFFNFFSYENVVEIISCVYTKTIILLHLGIIVAEYLHRRFAVCKYSATIHLDFKE